MPHAFWGAITASKCQDLICASVMWTHGPEERGDTTAPEGFTRWFWSADVKGWLGSGGLNSSV